MMVDGTWIAVFRVHPFGEPCMSTRTFLLHGDPGGVVVVIVIGDAEDRYAAAMQMATLFYR